MINLQKPEHHVLCWLATVDRKNRPNVSPKEIFTRIDDGLLVIADIASARSLRNITENNAVCVSMIDIFLQRGRKIEGTARIIAPDHADFAALSVPLQRLTAGQFPIRNIIAVDIQKTIPILAPSYRQHPERSETDLQNAAYQAYGVTPR